MKRARQDCRFVDLEAREEDDDNEDDDDDEEEEEEDGHGMSLDLTAWSVLTAAP
jgi:hypothetical protein